MHLSKLTKPAAIPIVIANLDVTETSSTSLLHLHGISGEFTLSPSTPMHSLSGKELWVPEQGVCPRCSIYPGIIGQVVQLLNTCSLAHLGHEGLQSVEGVHFLAKDPFLRNRSLHTALWRQERGRAHNDWGSTANKTDFCFLSISWLKRSECGLWNKSLHFKGCASWIRNVYFCLKL